MNSVTGNAALLKKTYIPKYIFTVAKVTSALVDYAFSLGALIIVMIFTRTPFHLSMLLIPILMIQLYIFCLGVGFLLAELNVYFRDIQYIYKAITTAWMYLTPIFYPIDILPAGLRLMIENGNAMYYYIMQFRIIVLEGVLPSAKLFVGGWVFALAMFAIGLSVFQKHKDNFILYI